MPPVPREGTPAPQPGMVPHPGLSPESGGARDISSIIRSAGVGWPETTLILGSRETAKAWVEAGREGWKWLVMPGT